MNNMQINRTQIENLFAGYVKNYNDKDSKVKLKIDHTYRVANLCEQIAKSLDLTVPEIDLAWLLGMLHDIGRFEQIRRYGTFSDAESIDHAMFGADLLFGEGLMRKFVTASDNDLLIETAIRNHSVYRIPEDLDEETKMFCHILRDADKIDILKVNVEVPLEEIYNVTTEELYHCEVSPAVMDNFKLHRATLRSLKQTPIDHVVGHISLVYELVYPISLHIVKEQGYLDKLLSFESSLDTTKEQFAFLRREMETYLIENSNNTQSHKAAMQKTHR